MADMLTEADEIQKEIQANSDFRQAPHLIDSNFVVAERDFGTIKEKVRRDPNSLNVEERRILKHY